MQEGMLISLVKIMKKYIDNKKMVDEDFYIKIYKLFNVSIYGRKLSKLVYLDENTRLSMENKKYTKDYELLLGLAAYNSETKELIVCSDNIDQENSSIIEGMQLDIDDTIILYNLLALQTMLHEYEHIIQEYKKNENKDFEGNMLNYIDCSELTTGTYDYSMKERLAELNSLRNIIFIMDYLEVKSSKIYDYFYKRIISTQQVGYEEIDGKIVSPVENYLAKTNGDINKSYNIDIDDIDIRILYGLPVDISIYKEYIKKEEVEIQKVYRKE